MIQQKFEIVLKNEKAEQYKFFAWLIIIFNMLLFGVLAAFSDPLAGLGGIIGFIFCFIILYALKRNHFDISRFLLLIPVPIWIIAGYYGFAVLSLFLCVLYFFSIRKKIIVFSKSGIVYPSFPQINLFWNELHHTILKDGLLTIDLRNNRLIQQLIDETKTVVNEQDFNDFCSQQLNK